MYEIDTDREHSEQLGVSFNPPDTRDSKLM
jgi:hypothetical protein